MNLCTLSFLLAMTFGSVERGGTATDVCEGPAEMPPEQPPADLQPATMDKPGNARDEGLERQGRGVRKEI